MLKKLLLELLTPNELPSAFDKGGLAHARNRERCRELEQKLAEPLSPGHMKKLLGFWEVQRQIMVHETVQAACASQRDLMVSIGDLLNIHHVLHQRIVEWVREPLFHEVQDDTGILTIMLVPGLE